MARKDLARLGVAVAILLGGLSQAQAAGLFEGLARAIFGSPRLYASPIYERDEPPRPRQRHRTPEVASKPTPPVVALDPQTDPYWYLKDPTLRRGDIVVTAGGVLVYQGRDSDASRPADFVALGGSDPKGWKQKLQTAAAGGRTMFHNEPARPETVTAEAGESDEAGPLR